MCVGNLEEIRKSLKEIEKHQTNGQAKQQVIVPKKEKSHVANVDTKNSNSDTSEFLEKYKAVRMQKTVDKECNKTADENGSKVKNGDHNDTNKIDEEEEEEDDDIIKKEVVPPVPLPRKSISEQSSFEDNSSGIPKPKPRQTGNCNNYKVYHHTHFSCFFHDFYVFSSFMPILI